MPSFDSLRVLLLQMRPDAFVREHERKFIVETAGLRSEQVVCLDTLEADLSPSILDGFDALIIGGSGDYLISQGHIPNVVEKIGILIREARARHLPTLGICFGAQLMTIALGGRVVYGPDHQETGTFEISKTPVANLCPIFSELPARFNAQLGHKDHLDTLPPGAVHLASSSLSPLQAYTFPGEPLYAMILHPEIDEDGIAFRLDYYQKEYGLPSDVTTGMRSRLRPSPDASRILRLFFEKVVCGGKTYPVKLLKNGSF
ncbi:MAG TPA: type 1 glutamine amidotransferase [Patescibacteria group bacterium]|nr:type 1 glutamine amidotransferase [Patescibacteria group bacterium]